MTKLAINGFGRIGRNVLRALHETGRTDLSVVAVNDLSPLETSSHLFEFDTVHGTFRGEVESYENTLCVNGFEMRYTSERDPAALPWSDVDIVLECTGVFRSREKAALHFENGTKRVLLSAPGKGEAPDNTVVFGVNEDTLTAEHHIVSNASCTTNCLAPAAKALHEGLGLKRGFITTVHSYTASQNVLDKGAKDLRRARAAAENIIPTTTGAAKAVGLVLPELAGKLDGVSIRVPTPNVSAVDFTFETQRATTPEEIITLFEAVSSPVIGVSHKPLVSRDFNHDPRSCVLDAAQTRVLDHTMARVLLWYDNEWGFSNRMLDIASEMGKYL